MPLEIKPMYFGNMPQKRLKKDKYLLNVLLAGAKKALTRKSNSSLTLNGWVNTTVDIYTMEKIAAFVNHELEHFTSRCEKLIRYGMPLRPDFVFIDY